mgnify:CR=1 FL=1
MMIIRPSIFLFFALLASSWAEEINTSRLRMQLGGDARQAQIALEALAKIEFEKRPDFNDPFLAEAIASTAYRTDLTGREKLQAINFLRRLLPQVTKEHPPLGKGLPTKTHNYSNIIQAMNYVIENDFIYDLSSPHTNKGRGTKPAYQFRQKQERFINPLLWT